MSQHRSYRGGAQHARHRSVLKRGERIKSLEKEGKWSPERSVFSLPKVKTVRFRVKKEKAAAKPAPGEAPAEKPAPGAQPKQEKKSDKTPSGTK
ncbi:MAG: small basic protein [Candidatus Omnitrophica bacterium]|nr:small basic protein [Candidatus Omnitrophota bacterium]